MNLGDNIKLALGSPEIVGCCVVQATVKIVSLTCAVPCCVLIQIEKVIFK